MRAKLPPLRMVAAITPSFMQTYLQALDYHLFLTQQSSSTREFVAHRKVRLGLDRARLECVRCVNSHHLLQRNGSWGLFRVWHSFTSPLLFIGLDLNHTNSLIRRANTRSGKPLARRSFRR
jgi:hypothetical protein